jgi:hypothetical protein
MRYDLPGHGPFSRHFGGGGPGKPPENKPAPTEEDPVAAKERSDREALARKSAKKRKGSSAARLTDPVLDAAQEQERITSDADRRVSIIGGGEYRR